MAMAIRGCLGIVRGYREVVAAGFCMCELYICVCAISQPGGGNEWTDRNLNGSRPFLHAQIAQRGGACAL